MADNDAVEKPKESDFLETIEDSNGDDGLAQTQRDFKKCEQPGTSGSTADMNGRAATAADIPGIIETTETSYGALGEVEQPSKERKEDRKDDSHTINIQSTPGEDEYFAPKADFKKDGSNAEDPNNPIPKIIDPQNAFPDHPIYDYHSLQTVDGSNPSDVQDQEPIKDSSESNFRNSPDKKIDSDNHLQPQNDSSLDGTSAAQRHTTSHSRRQSKDSLDPWTSLSVNGIRNLQTSRSSTVFKPKSSLLEPEHKHQKEEFLDSNMLISNTKLDGLLFRLFSLPGRLKGNDEKHLPFLDDGKSDIISMDPVIWNLRPMTAVQKETLDSEMEFLEDTLMPKQVVRQLFMDGILTHMDYNQITRTEGQGDKAIVRLLIGTLKRRGEKAFPQFMKALKDLHHARVWERLDTTERSLSESLADDQRRSERRSEVERLTTRSILKTRFKEDEKSEDILRKFLQSNFDDAVPPGNLLTGSKVVEEDRYGSEDQTVPVHGSSPSSERLQSRQLEQQLEDINAELKALHEGLNLLQSARSSTIGVPQSSQENPTATPIQSLDSGNPNNQTPKTRPHAVHTDDIEEFNMDAKNSTNSNNKVQQKSGTCVIL